MPLVSLAYPSFTTPLPPIDPTSPLLLTTGVPAPLRLGIFPCMVAQERCCPWAIPDRLASSEMRVHPAVVPTFRKVAQRRLEGAKRRVSFRSPPAPLLHHPPCCLFCQRGSFRAGRAERGAAGGVTAPDQGKAAGRLRSAP